MLSHIMSSIFMLSVNLIFYSIMHMTYSIPNIIHAYQGDGLLVPPKPLENVIVKNVYNISPKNTFNFSYFILKLYSMFI